VTPSPLIPTTTPSSQRRPNAGRNAMVGKEFARVIPAFLWGYLSSTARIARRMGAMEVTAALSLNSFGISGSPTCMIQSMIRAVRAAFCETMAPSVPSPPCGQDNEYSIPIAPAASSFFVLDCQPAESEAWLPVTWLNDPAIV
jgi:hypothetical protein